ncbi:hypothetical protein SprV_0802628400 [Sparganum proliferum]
MRRTHRSYFRQRRKIGETRVAGLLAGTRVVTVVTHLLLIHFTVSDRANITGVAAPAAGTLEVRWVNPSNPNVTILSSKAFARSTDGGSKANCRGSTVASSATNCSLTGLRNFTKYEVWVVICIAPGDVYNEPLKEEVYPGAGGGNCAATSTAVKWTIPTAPDPANITAVAAPAPGTLEVRWVNPSKANGNLSSSRAIARPKEGGSEVTCNGTTEAETNCSLTGLRNFTEYEVWVEVCTAQAKVEVEGDARGGGCTNSSVKRKWTIPTVSDRANITGVAAPAAGTLEVRWVNPSNPNVTILSSKAFARSTDGGSKANCRGSTVASSATNCSLTGLRNFTKYEVWVVICIAPGDVYNEPLKEEVYPGAGGGNCAATSTAVKWTIPTAPDPANITAVAAPAPGTLEVRWVNPSKANGNLSSSRAIARPKEGGSEVTCNGTTEAETNCSLTGLRNFTEYEVWVEVCTAQAKVEVEGDARGGGCTNSSVKRKWTIPTVSDRANITGVAAPAAGTLEVRWVNPSNPNVTILSSKAFARSTDGGSKANCRGSTVASSATNCSLTGLRNFTKYEVWVVICIAPGDVYNEPLKEEVYPGAGGGNCAATSTAVKWTIPTAPDPANITAVAAPAPGTLEVRWVNPSKANGNLSSSRAIARPKEGGSEVTCNGTTEAETNCSLTGLRNFTEYEVWVEVCTAQAKVEVEGDARGGGCTNSSVKRKWTIPTVSDRANITGVAAPASGTLEVRWVNPSKANGNLSSSTAMAGLPFGSVEATCYETAEASSATKCSLTGLRVFTEYEVWVEVCTAPAKVEVEGDARGGGCTNSSSVRIRTLGQAEAVGTSTGLIVGITFACLVVLAVVLFVVFWMRRRRTARSPPAKPEDFNFDPRKSHADIEPQYDFQTQYELASQQDGVYEMENGVDVGGPKMNVYVDMPTLSCLKTNMPSQQPPPLPPRSPEEIPHPTYINLPGSTDALAKVTAPNVSLSANRLENAVTQEGAGDEPQGQPQASAVTLAGEKPVLPPRPQSE